MARHVRRRAWGCGGGGGRSEKKRRCLASSVHCGGTRRRDSIESERACVHCNYGLRLGIDYPTGLRCQAPGPVLYISTPPTPDLLVAETMNRSNYDAVYSCRICFRSPSSDPSKPEFFVSSCGHVVCSVHIFPSGGFSPPPDSIELYLQVPLLP